MHFLPQLLLAASLVKASQPLLPQTTPPTIAASWKFVHSLTSPKYEQEPLDFTLVLKSADDDGLTRRMAEIAERGDGRWLTLSELKSYAAPTSDSKAAVLRYLDDNGFHPSQYSFNEIGDHLKVKSTLHATAQLFNASFGAYSYRQSRPVPRTTAYTIPSDLADHVEHVFPIASFLSFDKKIIKRAIPSTHVKRAQRDYQVSEKCEPARITPTCLSKFYGFDTFTPAPSSAKLGIFGGFGEYYNSTLLFEFLSVYRPEIADHVKVKVINVIQRFRNNASDPGGETAFDFAVAVPQIYPLIPTYYSTGDELYGDLNNPLMDAFDYLISENDRPDVFSISYGYDESDLTIGDAAAICKKIQQVTSLGVTVVSSSGDFGPSSYKSIEGSCPPFQSHFPATCPFVLSVGATSINEPGVRESMVDAEVYGFYSGSSRSTFFPIPQYQADALESYQKKLGSKNEGLYNANGRSIPDVVACGSSIIVTYDGIESAFGGDSGSAPLVASMLTLVVSARNSTGKGPLGWVNPTLYKHPHIFTDIVDGGSYCVNGDEDLPGFPATPGFDSSSGLGSPSVQALLRALG